MLEFAEWQFWGVQKEEGSKISRIDNLKQAAKSGSKKAQQRLDESPKLSPDLNYLWHMFLDLHNAGNGTISYQDIKAYSDLQSDVSPFEVEAIQAMNVLRNKHD